MQTPDDQEDAEPKFIRRSLLTPATKLCPRCLSPLSARSKLGGWLVPQDYFCTKCGYAGTAFLERNPEPPKTGNE